MSRRKQSHPIRVASSPSNFDEEGSEVGPSTSHVATAAAPSQNLQNGKSDDSPPTSNKSKKFSDFSISSQLAESGKAPPAKTENTPQKSSASNGTHSKASSAKPNPLSNVAMPFPFIPPFPNIDFNAAQKAYEAIMEGFGQEAAKMDPKSLSSSLASMLYNSASFYSVSLDDPTNYGKLIN